MADVNNILTRWQAANSETEDFSQLSLRPSIHCLLPLFAGLFSIAAVIGIIGNISIIVVIVRQKLYNDSTFFIVGNIATCEVIRCIVVIPASVIQIFLYNWHFGPAMCSILPMLLWCPICVTSLMLLAASLVRLWVFVRIRVPVPFWVWLLCSLLAWATAVCVTTPFIVYVKAINISEHLGPKYQGLGLCMLKENSQTKMAHLVPAMYVIMFLLPLIITSINFFIIILKSKDKKASPGHVNNLPLNITFGEEEAENQNLNESANTNDRSANTNTTEATLLSTGERQTGTTGSERDRTKEQRINKYLVLITIQFAVLWLPFLTFFTVTWSPDGPFPVAREDYKDVLHIVFLFVGFLSSCFLPVVFSLWQLSRAQKEKIKSFFRFPRKRSNTS